MNSVIPDCDWKPYEGGDLTAIRGEFKPDILHKLKRILGILFFFVFMPGFGLAYLYTEVFQSENPHFGATGILGLLVCFGAPFVFGKAILQSKPGSYEFTDTGIEIAGEGVVLTWKTIT